MHIHRLSGRVCVCVCVLYKCMCVCGRDINKIITFAIFRSRWKIGGVNGKYGKLKEYGKNVCSFDLILEIGSEKKKRKKEYIIDGPLLVALTYADERLFKPDVPSSAPSRNKTRDRETIVRNNSVIFTSSLAEHSSTLTLQK